MMPQNRMVVAAAALVGAFVSTYLLLYKLGHLGTLACGIDGGCEIVQATRFAYFLGVPVAAWGVAGYLGILGVALAGTRPRFVTAAWVSWGLLLLTGAAFAFSLYLSALEEWVIQAWCRWCIASALIASATFVFSLPEAKRLRK
ncbi:MAG TPA: vitamin K epoxide reductase family protein [Longimicrobiales bacterium]|nr:vitamin K epoxide reductase family protein [Longimicrobiales bacterium]